MALGKGIYLLRGHLKSLPHELVHVRGRTDVEATLLGFGDCLEQLRSDCSARGLDDAVEGDEEV